MKNHGSLRKSLLAVVACLFVLAIFFVHAAPASAQNKYDELQISQRLLQDTTLQRDMRNMVRKFLADREGGSKPEGGEDSRFRGWFTAFAIPPMTQLDRLGEYSELRRDFIQSYLRAAKNDNVRPILNEICLREFAKIVKGNFHPAAKYNAMLLIGELNVREEQKFGTRTPARPYSQAFQFMMAELNSPFQLDAVKVAALVGIRRHVELEPRSHQDTIAKLLPLAASTAPPAEDGHLWVKPPTRSPAGHFWMKRMALEILASIARVSRQPEIAKLMFQTVDDPTMPASVRFAAATQLGSLPGGSGLDVEDAAKAMGSLLSESLLAEVKAHKQLQDKRENPETPQTGGGRGRGGPAIPVIEPGLLGPTFRNWEVDRLYRYAMQRSYEVKSGLQGADGKGGLKLLAPSSQVIKDVLAEIKEIEELKDGDEPLDMDTLLDQLRVSMDNISKVCKREKPMAAEPMESEDDMEPAELDLGL